jgi:hypothetical protein
MIFPFFNYSTIADMKVFDSLRSFAESIWDHLLDGIPDETAGILPPDALDE